MKIIELRATGFRRIKAVTIRPDGNMVQIKGRNGQGKTSTLDAIYAALKGRAVAGVQPVNKDAEKAVINLDLGDMTVIRTFAKSKDDGAEVTSSLKIALADGSHVRHSPQAMLDALVGDLSFDPLEFARAKPKDQFDALKQFVTGVDFEDNANQRQELFDERASVNRQLRDAEGAAAAVQLPTGPKPKPVNVAEVNSEMLAAAEHNAAIATMERANHRDRRAAQEKLDESEDLLAQAATLERQAKTMRERAKTMEEKAAHSMAEIDKRVTPKPIDIAPIRERIANATMITEVIRRFDERDQLDEKVEHLKELSLAFTNEIKKLDDNKREAIADAIMPVKDLSLSSDGEVTFRGVPFSQASHAEKLRVSIAVAMAANPDLRVIRAYEGSTLDQDSLAAVAEMARDKDYQVWIETVGEGGENGILIEDGEVVAS